MSGDHQDALADPAPTDPRERLNERLRQAYDGAERRCLAMGAQAEANAIREAGVQHTALRNAALDAMQLLRDNPAGWNNYTASAANLLEAALKD